MEGVTKPRWELLVALAAATLLAAVVTAASAESLTAAPGTMLFILLGPLTGWFVAIETGQVVSGLGLLLPATFAVLIPLVVYGLRRSAVPLTVACLFWVASGWLFTVAIWI